MKIKRHFLFFPTFSITRWRHEADAISIEKFLPSEFSIEQDCDAALDCNFARVNRTECGEHYAARRRISSRDAI